MAFSTGCREAGVVSSMGKAGDCFDNAMAESFFASLECEIQGSPGAAPWSIGRTTLNRDLAYSPPMFLIAKAVNSCTVAETPSLFAPSSSTNHLRSRLGNPLYNRPVALALSNTGS